MLPPSSESKSQPSEHQKRIKLLLLTLLTPDPEDDVSNFLRNVGELLPDYKSSHPMTIHYTVTAVRTSYLTKRNFGKKLYCIISFTLMVRIYTLSVCRSVLQERESSFKGI
jgi:hypothetical protein